MGIDKLYYSSKRTLETLVAPFFCCQCRKITETGYICNKCYKELRLQLTITCPFCERRKPFNEPLDRTCCNNLIRSLLSLAIYEEQSLSQLIRTAKYQGYFEVFSFFGQLIGVELNKLDLPTNFTFVPIPLHRARLQSRGFNQAEVLTQVISQKTNLPVSLSLERKINNKPQALLTGKERLDNVKGIFEAKPPIPDNIIIIDDIWTTGATMKEAATILKQHGAKKILGLVILK
jgi:ComF family protein